MVPVFSDLSMTIPPVMFGESQFVDKNETDVEIRTVTLTKEVWTTLKEFNHENQITNFEFFIGIYQQYFLIFVKTVSDLK
jgi:hypothetical protein